MLNLRPITYAEAREYVRLHHRHNKPPAGHKFSVAVYDDNRLCGVCMVGRPVGRYLDDGMTLEVNRCCTDGTKNACSMLYGAAARAAKALGYTRIITYTRDDEPGGACAQRAGIAKAARAARIGPGAAMRSRWKWRWT